jgi:hypothetical protein
MPGDIQEPSRISSIQVEIQTIANSIPIEIMVHPHGHLQLFLVSLMMLGQLHSLYITE